MNSFKFPCKLLFPFSVFYRPQRSGSHISTTILRKLDSVSILN
jgi:hypothetical protein